MMSSDRWLQIKKILAVTQEFSPTERAAYIKAVCAGDDVLRQEVEALLSADLDRVSFLEATPPLRLLSPLLHVGEGQIGAYRILRELGHGGMGTVYLAARAGDEFERQVALKVLRPGSTSPELERRFRQEIQILANLNHPNIAKLYEMGRSEEGNLYFLMEYIEGLPITSFCEERCRSIAERLQLFRRVCNAVQYAHQNFVAHRDLKPSNILVTREGEPKLLDFGIAKFLDPLNDSPPTAVSGGLRIFTPEYASPEQVLNSHVTTSTDVYSLGVLLFELLAGCRPYRFRNYTEKELRQVICEETPELPSTVLAEREQGKGARKIQRTLKGDLDRIVLMALRKEPNRRYLSVEQFSEDINRYLTGFPVQAQSDTWGYRARRFVQRNRVLVGAVAALILLSLAFGTLMAFEQRRTARERDRAEQVSEFMVEVFGASDPRVSPGEDEVTARTLLDEGAKEVTRRFAHQPELRADLLETISLSYDHLGLYAKSLPLHKEVLASRRITFGEEHPEVAESLTNVGRALHQLGELDAAEKYILQALRIWRQVKDPDQLGSATSLTQLGLIRRTQGNYKEAERYYREALRIRRSATGPNDSLLSESIHNLSVALKYQQDYKTAIPLAREALAIDRKLHGELHPDILVDLDALAVLLRRNGDFLEAERTFQEAIALGRRLYPHGHTHVAVVLNDYALLKANQADHLSAEKLYRQSLSIDVRFRGRDHPHTAITIINLATALRAQERFQEAEPLYREALSTQIRHLGRDNPETLEGQAKLAEFLWTTGKKDEAEALLAEVAMKRRQIFSDEAPIIATDLHNLSVLKEARGKLAEAESLSRQALERDRRSFQPSHPNIVRDLHRLASILGKVGRSKECESLIREALQYLPTQVSKEHWRVAEAENILGGCLVGQGRYGEAEPLLLQSYDRLKQSRGLASPQAQSALRRVTDFYEATGRSREATQHRKLLAAPE